jgi:hypothetical protein
VRNRRVGTDHFVVGARRLLLTVKAAEACGFARAAELRLPAACGERLVHTAVLGRVCAARAHAFLASHLVHRLPHASLHHAPVEQRIVTARAVTLQFLRHGVRRPASVQQVRTSKSTARSRIVDMIGALRGVRHATCGRFVHRFLSAVAVRMDVSARPGWELRRPSGSYQKHAR